MNTKKLQFGHHSSRIRIKEQRSFGGKEEKCKTKRFMKDYETKCHGFL
jgi:hypothetical protein